MSFTSSYDFYSGLNSSLWKNSKNESIGKIKYKKPKHTRTIDYIWYVCRIDVSKISYPAGLIKSVKSNNFKEIMARFPEILCVKELLLNKLYLSTQ